MNIWQFINKKSYWSGYLDGVKSRTEPTGITKYTIKKRKYKTAKRHRQTELLRYYKKP